MAEKRKEKPRFSTKLDPEQRPNTGGGNRRDAGLPLVRVKPGTSHTPGMFERGSKVEVREPYEGVVPSRPANKVKRSEEYKKPTEPKRGKK